MDTHSGATPDARQPDGLRPPKAWISQLREPAEVVEDRPGPELVGLHPLERDAIDSAVPFAAEHARRYIASAGRDDGWDGPRPILLLYTVGRRSGTIRRNPVLYFDHRGERFIIASKGGDSQHPVWYLNLIANPDIHVRADAAFYPAVAEVLTADERAAIWPFLVAAYEMFASYQQRTDREIPLIRVRMRVGD